MGLDITAYSNLKHIGQHEKDPAKNEGEPGGIDDYCYYEYHVEAFAYDDFPQSFRGIPIIGPHPRHSEFIYGGCFAHTEGTETYGFRAGSYGGYGRWRADLQQQFNPLRREDGPFYELIWFADNEGCIGPEAAADLLADFREHAEKYDAGDEYPDYMREKYADWTRAFELAANNGLVYFH